MIPASLKDNAQWVVWRLDNRNGKPTKVPINPATGKMASSTDPTTWSDYDTAVKAVAERKLSGVGFVFHKDDPFTGVDLDKCRNPETGSIEPWAKEYLDELSSYSEVSPSGAGVHVFVRGKLTSGGRRRVGGVEMYSEGRYFTVTGDHIDSYPFDVLPRQAELERCEVRAFGKKPELLPAGEGGYELADDEVIAKAKRAINGTKFESLWAGNTGAYNGDDSAADMALCNILAFYSGKDPSQMDRLFRRSGLMREKWTSKRGASTYGRDTIDRAIADTREVYEPRRRPEPPARVYDPPTRGGSGTAVAVAPKPELEGKKEKVSSMVRRIEHDHILLSDDNGGIYEYNGISWEPISIDTLRRYAMSEDEREHTSQRRRNEVADQLQKAHGVHTIQWRQINQYEIPCHNGVVDLRDGSIRPHRKNDYLETVVPHDYDPAAACARWLKALSEWFEGDPDCKLKVDLLREFFGYILMPHARYKKAMIMYGPSNTGKSQALGAMVAMVGNKNHTSIGVHEMDDPRKLAPIKGKMLNQIGELSEDVLIADSGFKRLVSVGEPVRIDPKWGHVEEYLPSCKHVICTNNLPQVRDYTTATFNRMAMLKFNRVFTEREQDKFLIEKFQAEMPGIMLWAIRGAESLFRNKGEFTSVEESEIEIRQYRSEQNPVVAFLEDMTIRTLPGTALTMEEFRRKYREWDPASGGRLGDTKITQMLKKAGEVVKNRYFRGRTRRVLEERSWAV